MDDRLANHGLPTNLNEPTGSKDMDREERRLLGIVLRVQGKIVENNARSRPPQTPDNQLISQFKPVEWEYAVGGFPLVVIIPEGTKGVVFRGDPYRMEISRFKDGRQLSTVIQTEEHGRLVSVGQYIDGIDLRPGRIVNINFEGKLWDPNVALGTRRPNQIATFVDARIMPNNLSEEAITGVNIFH